MFVHHHPKLRARHAVFAQRTHFLNIAEITGVTSATGWTSMELQSFGSFLASFHDLLLCIAYTRHQFAGEEVTWLSRGWSAVVGADPTLEPGLAASSNRTVPVESAIPATR